MKSNPVMTANIIWNRVNNGNDILNSYSLVYTTRFLLIIDEN